MNIKQGQSQRLRAIVDTIVQVARPERVILFGSRAKGTARNESVYDFLVVVRDIRNEREVSRRIYRAFLDRRVEAAVDVVVVNAETLEQHRELLRLWKGEKGVLRLFLDRGAFHGLLFQALKALPRVHFSILPPFDTPITWKSGRSYLRVPSRKSPSCSSTTKTCRQLYSIPSETKKSFAPFSMG